ncbi:MAG: type I methionyl aminopeptidase [Deltaproteobacteria bacterium CG11_big_fil_rev_8_21_14_0_20_45_16]|nr:MAG: type I methionyl aminopeptidase [Deltaproteobacteria bacterium CG11_big_fil_rev_8_21_14_0_20_45_16]
MMTPKMADQIRHMEKVGKLAAEVLVEAGKLVRPGITPNEINQFVHEFTLSRSARPAPLNYHGFPKSVCTSINTVVCHGVPDDRPLKEGDIINIDVTCEKSGYYGDTSRTFYVGKVSERAKNITEAAEEAMFKGIEQVNPNATVGDIGFAIEKFTTRKGFHVVRELGGHGIGKNFHEEPFVPSFGKKGRGDKLRPWIAITVEPMINETAAPIREFDIPGSTIKWYDTSDGSLSAQFEHTVLVTDAGHQILTRF